MVKIYNNDGFQLRETSEQQQRKAQGHVWERLQVS